jgi:hypothetical protein
VNGKGCGLILIVIGAVMMQIAAATFVATEQPGPSIGVIGAISLFTWWIPAILGFAVLIIGMFCRPD